MRFVVLMIPIALVGGYVVHNLSHRSHPPTPDAVLLPSIAPASPARPVLTVAAPHGAAALPRSPRVDAPFDIALDREVADGQFRVRGAASASMMAAVEGALQLVSRRLSAGDSLDVELVAELVTWSASLLADVAADFEGSLEIETPDGERVVINAAGRPSIRVEAR